MHVRHHVVSTLRSSFLGESPRRARHLAFAAGSFAVTFVGYAIGAFEVSGGVVWVPFHAAAVGAIVSAWIGYRRGGLPIAWIAVYASHLGFHAEWAVFGLPGRPIAERIGFFVSPDGLAFFGVSAVVFGTVAFAGGRSVRLLSERLAMRSRTEENGG